MLDEKQRIWDKEKLKCRVAYIFYLQDLHYRHKKAKFQILCGPNSNLNPKEIYEMWDSLYQNAPQMPKNLPAQFVCPSPKVLDFNEKRHHWASVVHDLQ